MKNEHLRLTGREVDVLKLIVLPEKLIADKLLISKNTVTKHMKSIRTKLRKANKAELTEFAVKEQII